MSLDLFISILISLGYGALVVQLWLIVSTAKDFTLVDLPYQKLLFMFSIIHVFCIAAYLSVLTRIVFYGIN